MFRHAFLIASVFLLAQNCPAQDYGRTNIVYQGTNYPAIQDLKNVLRPYRTGTIEILWEDLGNRTGQEFFLEIKADKTTIKYTTENSLNNAIYTYLDMLGFRWYGPGDNWFISPQTVTRPDVDGHWIKPTFRNRTFFGTGGLNFAKTQPYDPQNRVKTQWTDWMRRNRFNTDFGNVGHQGQNFYLQNKTLLTQNPDWFENNKGMQNGRIKIDSPNAVNAFKNWVRTVYSKSKTDFVTLGVDPADGRGGADDPLPKNMVGIKDYADKWWWLANQVAKDYTKDKNVVVTMYAYGDGDQNAKVPDFKLEENVYPVIIPYAFQTAYVPKEMVRKWARTIGENMGLYDYWNITQWSKDLPQFNIYDITPKLKFWQQNKVNGVYLESTWATGPIGHVLWLTGQLEWNLNQDFNHLYQQYLGDCFGQAAPFVKNMFDRWSKNYQDAADVVFSLQDLKNASEVVKKNSPEWKRLTELKAYVHFMKMYYTLDGAQKSKNELFNYLYSIHHLMLVQTAAFVGQRYIPPFDKGNIVPDGNNIRPLSDDDINKQFDADLASAPPSYQLSTFMFDWEKVSYIAPIPDYSWRFGSINCDFFFTAPFTGVLSLDAGAETVTPFRFYTDDSVLIQETVGTGNFTYKETIDKRVWSMKKFQIEIKKGQTYHLSTRYGQGRVKINTPGIVLFKNPGKADFDNYQYPVQYFYVPEDVNEIIFYDSQKEGTNRRGYLVTPDGKRLNRLETGFKNIFKVQVPPEYNGKIWTADFGHPSWRFMNIPNVSSLQKFIF